MKLTDALRGEHGLFQTLFDNLRARISADAEIAQIMDTIGAAVAAHAAVEEDLLFPALDPHIGDMGPLAVMRAEHEQIEDITAAIADAEDPAVISVLAGDLMDLLNAHFQKEELILFHLAEQYLDAAHLLALGDQWAARRGVSLEAGGCAAA